MNEELLVQIRNGLEHIRQILLALGSNEGAAECDKLLGKLNHVSE
jgi:hypothetical protein